MANTFSYLYNMSISMPQQLDMCLRLIIAFIVGGLVGMERSHRFKEAGIRTHILVCCAAALLMLVSKYGFADLAGPAGEGLLGTKGADSSRIASQVVSGISFLCAGVIFKVGSNIRGLTTAAGIWMTSGLGLAIGAGMYLPVTCSLILLWILQYVMYRLPFGYDVHGGNHLLFTVKSNHGFDKILHKQLEEWGAQVTNSRITRNISNGTTEYDLVIRRQQDLTYSEVREFAEKQGDVVISVSTSSLYMQS